MYVTSAAIAVNAINLRPFRPSLAHHTRPIQALGEMEGENGNR